MIFAGILLGAIVGGLLSGFPGVVAGCLLGYLMGSNHTLRTRLAALENDLRSRGRAAGPLSDEAASSMLKEEGVSVHAAHQGPEPPTSPELEPAAVPGAAKDAVQPRTQVEGKEGALPLWTPEWTVDRDPAAGQQQPAPETGLSIVQQISDGLNRFFTGGSMLVKTGIVVLFLGLSFLVKYAAEHDLFPIELRLATAALAGIALLAVGWRLRNLRVGYAHVLQGGGVAVLYLTTFAAFRLYALISPPLAFSILVAVAFVSSFLAVIQESRALAILGVSGGFLAPLLTSTGAGNHVVLFSYYALLNLGIAGIAWFRAWRVLNLVGFAFTFLIGTSWGWRYYSPEYFPTTEPFLVLFFLLYTLISVLFAVRHPPDLKGCLDGTLVFGTPMAAFALQSRLVEPFHFGLAWSATGLCLFYLPLAFLLFAKKQRFMRDLAEAFLAFGVLFGTLALPLALENRWTSAAWAVEGAGLIWAGTRQGRRLARAFGVLLQAGAGIFFLAGLHGFTVTTPILNGRYLGCVLVGLSGLFAARCLGKHRDSISGWEAAAGHLLLAWGMIWWISGGLAEIHRQVDQDQVMAFVPAFLALTFASSSFLGKALSWKEMGYTAFALVPMLYLSALSQMSTGFHPFSQGGWVGWPVAFAVSYLILYRHEDLHQPLLHFLHGAVFWLLTGLATWELSQRIDDWVMGSPVWPLSCSGAIPAIAVLLLSTAGLRLAWPVARHRAGYLTIAAGPVALYVWLWIWYANAVSSGTPTPLGYVPFVNPLDLAIFLSGISLTVWFTRLQSNVPRESNSFMKAVAAYLSAATAFFWLNGVLVRTVHHFAGVPFTFHSLYHSVVLQTSLSIFWSLSALCAMVIATRKGLRAVWLSGASLLGAVVLKLFLIDLSGTGTVARIVSFVVVGVLLLVVGYFSPVPPRGDEKASP